MILRLGANAATHAAAGAAMGLLGVLAACTLAQAALRGGGRSSGDAGGGGPLPGGTGPAGPAPAPPDPGPAVRPVDDGNAG